MHAHLSKRLKSTQEGDCEKMLLGPSGVYVKLVNRGKRKTLSMARGG